VTRRTIARTSNVTGYLSTTLQDAALIADQRTGSSGAQNQQAFSVTKEDLRVSQAARPTRQFKPKESPEWLKTVADQINAVALPVPTRAYGIRLPPEEYCLTGIGWNLDEEYLLSDDEDQDGEGEAETTENKMDVDSADRKSVTQDDTEMGDA
jgi:transcription initiation factor TFIID subunit 9B